MLQIGEIFDATKLPDCGASFFASGGAMYTRGRRDAAESVQSAPCLLSPWLPDFRGLGSKRKRLAESLRGKRGQFPAQRQSLERLTGCDVGAEMVVASIERVHPPAS